MKLTRVLPLPTRRAALGLSIGAIATVACGRNALAAGLTERADLGAVFAENGVAGTFVLYDVGADHLTLVNARRATSRRTGSNPERITASGVSSMIRSTPVAASKARMLRPSRPIMRPFISSFGNGTTETTASATWSEAHR